MKRAEDPNKGERYFEWWLDDLMGLGIVLDYDYEPVTFELCEPLPMYVHQMYATKDPIIVTKNLYDHLVYKIDYRVKFNGLLLHKLFGLIDPISRELMNDPNLKRGNVYQNTLFYSTDVDPQAPNEYIVWFEVKPPSNANNAESMRDFRYKARLLFQRHGIIANKVVPVGSKNCLFNKTFTPNRYLLQDEKNLPRRRREFKDGPLVPIKDLPGTVLAPEWLKSKGINLGI